MIVATKLQKVIDDLQEIQKSVYPGKNGELETATKIISMKLEKGLLYPEEITKERLMFNNPAFTEKEAEEILLYLQEQGLVK